MTFKLCSTRALRSGNPCCSLTLDLDKYVGKYKPPVQLAAELCDVKADANTIEFDHPDMLVIALSALTGVSTIDIQQVRKWTMDTTKCYCSDTYKTTMARLEECQSWYTMSKKAVKEAAPTEAEANATRDAEIEAIFM